MSEFKKVWNFYWIFWINEDVAKNWNWKISSFIPRSMYEWCTCVTFHTRKIISKFICVFQTNLCIIQMAQIPNIKCLTLIYCALITFWEKKNTWKFPTRNAYERRYPYTRQWNIMFWTCIYTENSNQIWGYVTCKC